ncbi:Bcr/CflA family multidrug efflux MFS transporter [Stutzerimonas stutzeri]|uniref:Bcr/CflA family efflux transporter n=1 Tax=Stutzerimonas stutzeri KOS6 TaxID=1218352 RepID=A0A061JUT9_STUST|nr:Bcr/CflA family multidrug efflux MFS transporter [Stutzerimonas stutzeri]EWC42463.1 MFS transporter [Stutzerimonas stutzeri KOS6]
MPALGRPQRLIVLLAALVAFGPLSVDLYLPSLPMIARDLQASAAAIQLTIGVFLGGISLGMLVYGPLSDRFGRRRLLLGGMLLYIVASLGCSLAADARQLAGLRLLQAFGAAAATVLARAIVRDLFPAAQAARILSLMHLVTMVATLIAPILGSYLMLATGWRSLFGALTLYAAVCLVLVAAGTAETHPRERRSPSVVGAFRAYGRLLGSARAVGLILCMALGFAGMFAYITASPFVYIEYFGVSAQAYAGLFALNIFGIIVVTLINARWVGPLGPHRMLLGGVAVAATSAVALAIVGALSLGGLPAVVLALLFYVSVTGLLGANCLASLLGEYPNHAGAAAGLAVATQFGLGMLASALVSAWHDGTPLPMSLIIGITGIGSALAYGLACAAKTSRSIDS